MAREISVKVGRPLTAEEVRALDRSRLTPLHPVPQESKPQESGVEGQKAVSSLWQCPYCGYVGYAWQEGEQWSHLYCPQCTTPFAF